MVASGGKQGQPQDTVGTRVCVWVGVYVLSVFTEPVFQVAKGRPTSLVSGSHGVRAVVMGDTPTTSQSGSGQ